LSRYIREVRASGKNTKGGGLAGKQGHVFHRECTGRKKKKEKDEWATVRGGRGLVFLKKRKTWGKGKKKMVMGADPRKNGKKIAHDIEGLCPFFIKKGARGP